MKSIKDIISRKTEFSRIIRAIEIKARIKNRAGNINTVLEISSVHTKKKV